MRGHFHIKAKIGKRWYFWNGEYGFGSKYKGVLHYPEKGWAETVMKILKSCFFNWVEMKISDEEIVFEKKNKRKKDKVFRKTS